MELNVFTADIASVESKKSHLSSNQLSNIKKRFQHNKAKLFCKYLNSPI